MSENKKDYTVDVVLALLFLVLVIVMAVLSVYLFCQEMIPGAVYSTTVTIVAVVVRCFFVQ